MLHLASGEDAVYVVFIHRRERERESSDDVEGYEEEEEEDVGAAREDEGCGGARRTGVDW
jgi:hypothetical protein